MVYEFIEHTADIRIRGVAPDPRLLFLDLAAGMNEYLFGATPPQTFGEVLAEESVELHAPDEVGLLVDWLSKILLLTSIHHGRVEIKEITHISPTTVHAKLVVVRGEQLEDIKAVTYHGLEVVHTPDGVEACVTFDI